MHVVDSDEVITATGDSTDGFVTFNNIEKGFFETDKYTLRVTAASRSLTLMPRLCRITP